MNFVTVLFDRSGAYKRLLSVFEESCKAFHPNAKIIVLRAQPEGQQEKKADTTRAFLMKTDIALKAVEPMAVCDCDLLFLRSTEDIWLHDFDIAVTARNWKAPWNSGVFFMRPTKQAKRFVQIWQDWTRIIAKDQQKYAKEITDHAGIDQAALEMTMLHEQGNSSSGARVSVLPCDEWNCCQDAWQTLGPKTRIVHVKSKLRQIVTRGLPIPEDMKYLEPIVEEWTSYER